MVGLWHLKPAYVLAYLLVRTYCFDTDILTKDIAGTDRFVGFGDLCEVVAHDRLPETHADVVLLLVGNDELVPFVEVGAQCVLRYVEPFAGEFGEREVNPQPQNLFGADEFGE